MRKTVRDGLGGGGATRATERLQQPSEQGELLAWKSLAALIKAPNGGPAAWATFSRAMEDLWKGLLTGVLLRLRQNSSAELSASWVDNAIWQYDLLSRRKKTL